MKNNKYGAIYADPPWQYNNYNYKKTKDGKKAKRGCRKEYNVMNIEEVKKLPVREIADENCVLFLWVTFPHLDKAKEVMNAWGFEYKTVAFVWVKKNKKSDSLFWGNGWWTRANPEICLMGVKGKPKRVSGSVHSVIISKIGKHSSKPKEARKRIDKLMGDEVKKIELFSRLSNVPGWHHWGRECKCNIRGFNRKKKVKY